MGSFVDKKENHNIINNMNATLDSTNTIIAKNLNYVPLDVPPPREIPETEKYLRDRKEK